MEYRFLMATLIIVSVTFVGLTVFFAMAVRYFQTQLAELRKDHEKINQSLSSCLGQAVSSILKASENNTSMIQDSLTKVNVNINAKVESGVDTVCHFAKENTANIEKELDILKKSMTIKFEELQNAMFIQEGRLASENKHWILEKNGIRKSFVPGKVVNIENSNDKTETTYKHEEGKIFCTVKKDGKLKSEMVFNSFGAPMSGKAYDENANVIKAFTYDELGRGTEVK